MLDSSTVLFEDLSILRLDFFRSFRDNAIIWLLGSYVEIVEREVVIKEHKLGSSSLIGILKQKKLSLYSQAIPDLGLIPGLDWDSEGVG